ncbi:MAG: hypothetical protein WAO71_04305 [Gallionella sp.]
MKFDLVPANTGKMLISKDKNTFKQIDAHKTTTGRFFTVKSSWLTAPVYEFIAHALSHAPRVLDPFAGDGHLLDKCAAVFNCKINGLDIHHVKWAVNDSLLAIPAAADQMIVTNPPYLAKYSASRKGVGAAVAGYFADTDDEDLYQIALRRCLSAARFVVAIIPETFLNSKFPKHALVAVSVLENNPFTDTDVPVCVACFDTQQCDGVTAARIYKADIFCATLGDIHRQRLPAARDARIQFNVADGQVALRAVDSTDPAIRIAFVLAADFHYARDKIKVSSRLLTYIALQNVPPEALPDLITRANLALETLRTTSHDLILSPFKGNNKAGVRRRRLDYALARGLLLGAMVAPSSCLAPLP